MQQLPEHWFHDVDLYSVRDLEKVKDHSMVGQLRKLFTDAVAHINNCEVLSRLLLYRPWCIRSDYLNSVIRSSVRPRVSSANSVKIVRMCCFRLIPTSSTNAQVLILSTVLINHQPYSLSNYSCLRYDISFAECNSCFHIKCKIENYCPKCNRIENRLIYFLFFYLSRKNVSFYQQILYKLYYKLFIMNYSLNFIFEYNKNYHSYIVIYRRKIEKGRMEDNE